MKFRFPDNFKQTAIYFIGDILVVATLSLFLLPFITNLLGVDVYGDFIYYKSIIEIITFSVIFGTTTAYSKFYVELSENEKKKYLFLIIISYVFICLSLIILIALFSNNYYYYAVILSCFGTSLSAIIGLKYRLEFNPNKFIFYQITTTLLLIVFSLASPYLFEDDLMGLLIATGLGYLIFIITGLLYLISSTIIQISINESFKIYKKIYYFGTPIFISYLSYFLYNKSSTFFLKQSNNLDDLAKLGISLQLGLIIYLTMGAYGKFYQPLILVKKLKAKIIYTYDYLILLTGLTLILIFYGQDLLSLIIDKSFFSTQLENSLILISSFFIGLKLIFDSQLLLANKPSYSMISSLIGGIIALVGFIIVKEITIMKIGVIMAISSFLILFFSVLLSKTSKFIYFDVLKLCFFLISIIITFQIFNEIRQYGIITILLPIWYLLKRRNQLQHD